MSFTTSRWLGIPVALEYDATTLVAARLGLTRTHALRRLTA
jgi:hypothetical protein